MIFFSNAIVHVTDVLRHCAICIVRSVSANSNSVTVVVKCRQRWDKSCCPEIIKGRWSNEEDQLLRLLVATGKCGSFGKIAKSFPGRCAKQCRDRWCTYLDPSLSAEPFTLKEDLTIVQLQQKLGKYQSKLLLLLLKNIRIWLIYWSL